MQIAPLPALASAVLRRRAFTASFSAVVRHDSTSTFTGEMSAFGAAGALSLPDGPLTGAPGDEGGLFDISEASGAIRVSFRRAGLGDGFAEGERVVTALTVRVRDGATTARAPVRVTVRRPFAPPTLVGAIPDQMDALS